MSAGGASALSASAAAATSMEMKQHAARATTMGTNITTTTNNATASLTPPLRLASLPTNLTHHILSFLTLRDVIPFAVSASASMEIVRSAPSYPSWSCTWSGPSPQLFPLCQSLLARHHLVAISIPRDTRGKTIEVDKEDRDMLKRYLPRLSNFINDRSERQDRHWAANMRQVANLYKEKEKEKQKEKEKEKQINTEHQRTNSKPPNSSSPAPDVSSSPLKSASSTPAMFTVVQHAIAAASTQRDTNRTATASQSTSPASITQRIPLPPSAASSHTTSPIITQSVLKPANPSSESTPSTTTKPALTLASTITNDDRPTSASSELDQDSIVVGGVDDDTSDQLVVNEDEEDPSNDDDIDDEPSVIIRESSSMQHPSAYDSVDTDSHSRHVDHINGRTGVNGGDSNLDTSTSTIHNPTFIRSKYQTSTQQTQRGSIGPPSISASSSSSTSAAAAAAAAASSPATVAVTTPLPSPLPLAPPPIPPLTLIILGARNLRPPHGEGRIMPDAYISLTALWSGSKWKTRVVKNSAHPLWSQKFLVKLPSDVKFTMGLGGTIMIATPDAKESPSLSTSVVPPLPIRHVVSDVAISSHAASLQTFSSSSSPASLHPHILRFRVYHKALFGKILLGEVSLTLADLMRLATLQRDVFLPIKGTNTTTTTTNGSKDEADRGEIQVMMTFDPLSNATSSQSSSSLLERSVTSLHTPSVASRSLPFSSSARVGGNIPSVVDVNGIGVVGVGSPRLKSTPNLERRRSRSQEMSNTGGGGNGNNNNNSNKTNNDNNNNAAEIAPSANQSHLSHPPPVVSPSVPISSPGVFGGFFRAPPSPRSPLTPGGSVVRRALSVDFSPGLDLARRRMLEPVLGGDTPESSIPGTPTHAPTKEGAINANTGTNATNTSLSDASILNHSDYVYSGGLSGGSPSLLASSGGVNGVSNTLSVGLSPGLGPSSTRSTPTSVPYKGLRINPASGARAAAGGSTATSGHYRSSSRTVSSSDPSPSGPTASGGGGNAPGLTSHSSPHHLPPPSFDLASSGLAEVEEENDDTLKAPAGKRNNAKGGGGDPSNIQIGETLTAEPDESNFFPPHGTLPNSSASIDPVAHRLVRQELDAAKIRIAHSDLQVQELQQQLQKLKTELLAKAANNTNTNTSNQSTSTTSTPGPVQLALENRCKENDKKLLQVQSELKQAHVSLASLKSTHAQEIDLLKSRLLQAASESAALAAWKKSSGSYVRSLQLSTNESLNEIKYLRTTLEETEERMRMNQERYLEVRTKLKTRLMNCQNDLEVSKQQNVGLEQEKLQYNQRVKELTISLQDSLKDASSKSSELQKLQQTYETTIEEIRSFGTRCQWRFGLELLGPLKEIGRVKEELSLLEASRNICQQQVKELEGRQYEFQQLRREVETLRREKEEARRSGEEAIKANAIIMQIMQAERMQYMAQQGAYAYPASVPSSSLPDSAPLVVATSPPHPRIPVSPSPHRAHAQLHTPLHTAVAGQPTPAPTPSGLQSIDENIVSPHHPNHRIDSVPTRVGVGAMSDSLSTTSVLHPNFDSTHHLSSLHRLQSILGFTTTTIPTPLTLDLNHAAAQQQWSQIAMQMIQTNQEPNTTTLTNIQKP